MAERSPMDYTYMKLTRELLHYLGSWPNATFGETRRPFPLKHNLFLASVMATLIVCEILYIRANYNVLSFFEIGQLILNILLTSVTVQRLSLPSTNAYKELIKFFVYEFHLFHHKHKSMFAMKVHKEVNKICGVFSFSVSSLMVLANTAYNVVPFINNCRAGMFSSSRPLNSTYEFSVYYQLPLEYNSNFVTYVIVSIANFFLTTDVAICFASSSICMCNIAFHTWGHLRILDHNLRNFPRPEMRDQTGCYLESPPWYSAEESETVLQLLKDNIEHHKQITTFVNMTSSTYGLTLFIHYAFHQITGCIFLLECSKMNVAALGQYGCLTFTSFVELIMISTIFELTATWGESLPDAVYNMPWECMGLRERRVVVIFLCNAQTPISFKAVGMVPVSVKTMATIIRTSISYFLFLRTTAMSKGH